MSTQANLISKIVEMQEDLKQIKASQTIGGDNTNYHEYSIPDRNFVLTWEEAWGSCTALFCFESEQPFPLCSIECDIYENGVLKPNVRSNCPTPYGGSSNSICTYNFLDNESYTVLVPKTSFKVNGREIVIGHPNNYFYMVEFRLPRDDNNVDVSFRNIKFRTSCRGVATLFFNLTAFGDGTI